MAHEPVDFSPVEETGHVWGLGERCSWIVVCLLQTEWLKAARFPVSVSVARECGRGFSWVLRSGSHELKAAIKLLAGLCSHPEARWGRTASQGIRGVGGIWFPAVAGLGPRHLADCRLEAFLSPGGLPAAPRGCPLFLSTETFPAWLLASTAQPPGEFASKRQRLIEHNLVPGPTAHPPLHSSLGS